MATTPAASATRAPHLAHYHGRITLDELANLCNDPARARPGGVEVRAILTYDAENGFLLSAQDGDRILCVQDADRRPVKYRTIEQAIEVLQDVAYLASEVRLNISASSRFFS